MHSSKFFAFFTQVVAQLFALFAIMIGLSGLAHAAETEPVDTGEVVGQIVSTHDVVAPGQSFHIAAYTVLNEHWHTYWKNPGDSGEPFDLMLELPDTLSSGELVWPLPKPVPTGPIVNYGFEGAPLFPVELTVSETAVPGEVLNINGLAYYLVCYDICIPEQFEFSLPIRVGEPKIDSRWSRNIRKALEAAPAEVPLNAVIFEQEGQLVFEANIPGGLENGYLYPFDSTLIAHSDPQIAISSDAGVRITASGGFGLKEQVMQAQKFVLGYDELIDGQTRARGMIVTAHPGAPLGLVSSADSPAAGMAERGSGASMSMIGAVIGAFLGGLVLNLMPCVFPVISMKALSFARHAHDERSRIRKQGWMYTIGVIVTFMVLTAILLILKATGAQIGWGFQLQSPWLVGLLALLTFAIGLNLIGAFEFGASLQNIGGNLVSKDGSVGAFFTGALAVIVATPCTAPFMAGAVGFALAQPAMITVIVFLSLAIGFAMPFLLLSYVPGLLAKLPKPGPWMERFKEVLAFPMFGAAIWLVWVLTLQAGPNGLFKILIAMLAIGFAVWLFKRGEIGRVLGVLVTLFAVTMPFNITTAMTHIALSEDPDLPKIEWSQAKVTELQNEGRAVFVDFTAAWCVTCKVNELGALSDSKVKTAFAQSNTAFVVADWTNRDDAIARELERYGRSGVPLYLYFESRPPGADNTSVRGQILPQILTVNMLLDLLEG